MSLVKTIMKGNVAKQNAAESQTLYSKHSLFDIYHCRGGGASRRGAPHSIIRTIESLVIQ